MPWCPLRIESATKFRLKDSILHFQEESWHRWLSDISETDLGPSSKYVPSTYFSKLVQFPLQA